MSFPSALATLCKELISEGPGMQIILTGVLCVHSVIRREYDQLAASDKCCCCKDVVLDEQMVLV